jgi:hypothetical protein
MAFRQRDGALTPFAASRLPPVFFPPFADAVTGRPGLLQKSNK